MKGFTEGRIVHYVMLDGSHRPAIIVLAWPDGQGCEGYANLQVFTDNVNDRRNVGRDEEDQNTLWRPSICYSEEKTVNTWHWIEPA